MVSTCQRHHSNYPWRKHGGFSDENAARDEIQCLNGRKTTLKKHNLRQIYFFQINKNTKKQLATTHFFQIAYLTCTCFAPHAGIHCVGSTVGSRTSNTVEIADIPTGVIHFLLLKVSQVYHQTFSKSIVLHHPHTDSLNIINICLHSIQKYKQIIEDLNSHLWSSFTLQHPSKCHPSLLVAHITKDSRVPTRAGSDGHVLTSTTKIDEKNQRRSNRLANWDGRLLGIKESSPNSLWTIFSPNASDEKVWLKFQVIKPKISAS